MSSSSTQEIRVYRRRDYKGKDSRVFKNIKGLQFSIILGFSELHYYGILDNEGLMILIYLNSH